MIAGVVGSSSLVGGRKPLYFLHETLKLQKDQAVRLIWGRAPMRIQMFEVHGSWFIFSVSWFILSVHNIQTLDNCAYSVHRRAFFLDRDCRERDAGAFAVRGKTQREAIVAHFRWGHRWGHPMITGAIISNIRKTIIPKDWHFKKSYTFIGFVKLQ